MKGSFVFGVASVAFVWAVGSAFAAKPEELVEFPNGQRVRYAEQNSAELNGGRKPLL